MGQTRATAILMAMFATGTHAQPAIAQGAKVSAREVVAAIQHEIPINWDEPTVDTFKAGNPDTPVTGIAVTMMATMDVLRRAAAQGDNLIITHEPTFCDHLDSPQGIAANDAVWTEKLAFIAKHGLVIWRFHDHWHRRTPDGIQAGMTRALGWAKYQDPTDPHLFKLPPTTLRKLADEVATKLDKPLLRIVGNPDMPVTLVAMSPGTAGFARQATALEPNGVDVLLDFPGQKESAHPHRPCAVRAGGHGGLCAVAEELYQGRADRIRRDPATLLDHRQTRTHALAHPCANASDALSRRCRRPRPPR
jgi:putative NIF3 family GTP cyclohydrolase 1 type 2